MDRADGIVSMDAGRAGENSPSIADLRKSEIERFADRWPPTSGNQCLQGLDPGATRGNVIHDAHVTTPI
jgi:hypothetical protein